MRTKNTAAPSAPAPETPAQTEDQTEFRAVESTELPPTPAPAPDDAADPQERELSPRETAMKEIVRRRREQVEREVAAGEPVGQPHAAAADGADEQEDSEAAESAAETSAPPAPPSAAATPSEPARTYRLQVNGQQIEVPEADMIRAAERGVYSDAMLREAQRVYAEAQRLQGGSAPASEPGAGASSPPAASARPSQSPPPGIDQAAALEIARELLYGDETKVAEAILRIAQRPEQQPSVDPDAIERTILARVDQRNRLMTDLQTFASEYGEIAGDPSLATLAAQYVNQLRTHYAQTGNPRAELDLYREAGTAVRNDVQRWTGVAAPQPPQPPPETSAVTRGEPGKRIAIKRSTPQAPTAAAAQQNEPLPQAKSGSDIVNDMRRARGQPVYA